MKQLTARGGFRSAILAIVRKGPVDESDKFGFDEDFYLTTYPEVLNSGLSPLTHFLKIGWKENKDPSRHFSTAGYLLANPDVAEAGVNPLRHFIRHGIAEGRSGWRTDEPFGSERGPSPSESKALPQLEAEALCAEIYIALAQRPPTHDDLRRHAAKISLDLHAAVAVAEEACAERVAKERSRLSASLMQKKMFESHEERPRPPANSDSTFANGQSDPGGRYRLTLHSDLDPSTRTSSSALFPTYDMSKTDIIRALEDDRDSGDNEGRVRTRSQALSRRQEIEALISEPRPIL